MNKPEVARLLELATELPASRRAEVLDREAPDTLVRAEVESLLEYAAGADSYFEQAIGGVALSLQGALEPAPGDVIGAYRVVSLIGRGGMGSVFLAERADGEIQQKVAVKLLRADGREHAWRRRFLKERQLLASLHHPSIVHVVDAGHTREGQPFLVMEYVEGIPIDQYAARIAVRERLKLFVRVCEGVSHAHRHLIIHRDLKPSNILVEPSGRPKLLDFGIAKLLDESGSVTMTMERVLTPNYASPEQLSGLIQTTATDVYSLGVILHELLTGMALRHPVSRASRGDVALPSRFNPDVPQDADFVVTKALRPEPEDRYASVDEFANDVRAILERRPVAARSDDVWYRTRRFLRRFWVSIVATVMVMASLATGLYIANRERLLAERRFGQLRQLATNVIDLDRTFQTLPGSVGTRQRLVAVSLEYLEGLSPEAQDNVDLAREIAEGYWRLGRIQGVNAEFNLGDPARAEDSLKKAAMLLERVLASRPQDRASLLRSAMIAHDRMILADSEERSADTLTHASRSAERLEMYEAAGDLREVERVHCGLLYGNIALTYVNMHLYREGARYARRAADMAKSAPSGNRTVSQGLSILANALRYQGDLDAALKTIREARAVAENGGSGGGTERLFALYGIDLREGLILGEEGAASLDRPAEAIAILQKALDIMEEAARKDPNDSASRTRVGTAARELGSILGDRDPRRALEVFDLGIQRLAETPNNVKASRDRAVLLARSSYPLRRLHRAAEAKERLDAALAVLRETKDSGDSVRLGGPAYSLISAMADYDAEIGLPAKALEQYQQLLSSVIASRPDPFDVLRETPKLSRIYAAMAMLYRRQGDATSAYSMETRRLELWRYWMNKLPDNAFIRRQLEAFSAR